MLKLRYQLETNVPVEVDGLVPERLSGLSHAAIGKLLVWHGNRQIPVGEAFCISDETGETADDVLRFEGDLSGVHRIGAGMTAGEIRVAGSAGRHVGSQMRGGAIHIEGSAGDWLGEQMRGGTIHVHGNAGGQVGAAVRGSRRGMTGGTILIEGNAGDELGLAMRRGLIAVGGNAGDGLGFNMIAGTILVFGNAGERAGAGMRRGTIGIFGGSPVAILPTFKHACQYRPQFLGLYFRELARLGFKVPAKVSDSAFDRYQGDHLELGKGEILVPV